MKIYRFLAILAALAGISISASAQSEIMTPYSRYGYGILNDNATSSQLGMGGVGYAMNSGRQINVMNPASYAAIDSLTFLFDMGVNMNMLWSTEGVLKDNSLGGGLNYITMSFPICKRVGASVGLLPYSSTNYSFSDSIANATTSHQGAGNVNQLYLGVGVNPFKGLYLGVNVAYMFGHTINDIYASTITGSTALFERYLSVRDWRMDIGLQYSLNINPANRVTIGLNYSPEKNLHGDAYGIYYDQAQDTSPDTIGSGKLNGLYSLPASYGGGINYQWNERLMVEADFLYQPWKDAKYAKIESFEANDFSDRWKVSLGAQYTPHPRGSYLKRTQYRAGVFYNHDYIMVRGNNVREYGASLGVGLPVPGFKTVVNLAFQYRHREASPLSLVKENYFNITLGVNFNQMWFDTMKLR